MNCLLVHRYLRCVHAYVCVDDNVQHEEMEVEEKLENSFHLRMDVLNHYSDDSFEYHANNEHSIHVTIRDQVEVYETSMERILLLVDLLKRNDRKRLFIDRSR